MVRAFTFTVSPTSTWRPPICSGFVLTGGGGGGVSFFFSGCFFFSSFLADPLCIGQFGRARKTDGEAVSGGGHIADQDGVFFAGDHFQGR